MTFVFKFLFQQAFSSYNLKSKWKETVNWQVLFVSMFLCIHVLHVNLVESCLHWFDKYDDDCGRDKNLPKREIDIF